MLKLVGQGHPPHIPADVIIKPVDGEGPVVRARGHLDEVLEMNQVQKRKVGLFALLSCTFQPSTNTCIHTMLQ